MPIGYIFCGEYGINNFSSRKNVDLFSSVFKKNISNNTTPTVIHLQFWAYGSQDSLFPISKLMSPEHYF